MHKAIGIERVVFTQPSIYGTDNGAILRRIRCAQRGNAGPGPQCGGGPR